MPVGDDVLGLDGEPLGLGEPVFGGGVVGVTVTVVVPVGVGMTGSGWSGSALRNSSQARNTASAMISAIVASASISATREAGRSTFGQGSGQIRNRPGRRRPSQ